MKYIITFGVIIFLAACNGNESPDHDSSLTPQPSGIVAPQNISYTIISQYPHDTSSFTEGLEFHNGKLYESGGDYINSALQYGDFKTGIIEKKK